MLPVQVGSGEDCCREWCSGGVWDCDSIPGLSLPCYRKNRAGLRAARPTLQTHKHRNDTTDLQENFTHFFQVHVCVRVSHREAGERGGFCGCWGHAEPPADRSVEEASGSHYSWRPWRERERENWWIMCMSERKCENELLHTPVRWAVWVCPGPPAAIPACYCRRSELWAAVGTDKRAEWTTGSDCGEKMKTKGIRNCRVQRLDLRICERYFCLNNW